MKVVLDASVSIEWFLPATNPVIKADALRLLKLRDSAAIDFLAPDTFWAEVGSVFTKAVRQKRWKAADALASLHRVRATGIESLAVTGYLNRAVELSLAHQQSVYDTLYVAMAIHHNLELITTDQRLYNALGALYPVRWLGGWISRI